ncbi:acid phosphatase type 7 [Marchantia polymorpha subsp. ruderalis]|uniref:Purple acid phosphatase n=4 Tax=Marchantia polymorpha TaxID=3197 RepID=A0AAF6AVP8_MARPO|nr:hypothetical protein MARPO_0209s0006 [Marchantia polymorpha]BBN00519.1 hypothetical protein Mp_1g29780 [Marchantia polymorpha subsp. ruderalis]|eukprot:PTQ27277.1 hypothetical protein MARPO_0209s0006 [Marchantia polymorpha]
MWSEMQWDLLLLVGVTILQLSFLVPGRTAALDPHQPLANLGIERTLMRLDPLVASISASPDVLDSEIISAGGSAAAYVTVKFQKFSGASDGDWVAVFSPADFNASSTCDGREAPEICQAPIKFSYANFSNPDYSSTGKGMLRFRLINQRSDFAFGFFTGDIYNPVLVAVSNKVSFRNPKAPGYLRLAQGYDWNEISVTWTSGYSIEEATPLVVWGILNGDTNHTTPASTLTFTREDICGPPASTVGWRDPGYIHSCHLKELWPKQKYFYQVGHKHEDGTYVWGRHSFFKAPPSPGENSLQRVIVFGDMGKAERDGSNEYANYQPGCLNTTDRLIEDLENFDLVFLIGDLSYSNGYLSQWDQFIEQVEPLSARVPLMSASGNHERSWPLSGGFYNTTDSGGECGVPAQTYFNMPTENGDKFWYKSDWGMFRFCVADSEHDWREGTEQYAFLENCMATVNRHQQPWLIFVSHRVLGYSSGYYGALNGAFGEPWGRDDLQILWQKYRVDLALAGHIHNYERTCPVFSNICTSQEKDHFSGTFNATIHMVVGGGGSHLADFTSLNTSWSLVKDRDYGFVKLTASNYNNLLIEYKRSSDGLVYDQFTIHRRYSDVLGCDSSNLFCPDITVST